MASGVLQRNAFGDQLVHVRGVERLLRSSAGVVGPAAGLVAGTAARERVIWLLPGTLAGDECIILLVAKVGPILATLAAGSLAVVAGLVRLVGTGLRESLQPLGRLVAKVGLLRVTIAGVERLGRLVAEVCLAPATLAGSLAISVVAGH